MNPNHLRHIFYTKINESKVILPSLLYFVILIVFDNQIFKNTKPIMTKFNTLPIAAKPINN